VCRADDRFFIATGTSLVLSLAAPNERGTTMAATRVISILLGTGLIPVMTGPSRIIGGAGSIRLAFIHHGAAAAVTYCYAMVYRILRRIESKDQRWLESARRGRPAAPDDRCAGEQNRDTRQGHGQIRACFDGA